MLRSVSNGFIRNISRYLRLKDVSAKIYHPRHYVSMGTKILIGCQACCATVKSEQRPKIDVEDDLRKACEEGSSAIILLMDTLKDFVLVVCKEYRSCLAKQIEITEVASKIGPLSEVWDELPHYRMLASELNKELEDYMMVFNTIGQLAEDDSLKSFVAGSTDKLHLIAAKYKELDTLLQKEFAQNKEIEKNLLEIKRNSILSGVN